MRYAGRARLFAAAALALGGLVAGCSAQDGDVAAAPPSAGASAAADRLAPGPVWPATSAEELARLQDLADRGSRPELLDPVGVARQYVTVALPAAARLAATAPGWTVGPFTASGPTTGEVPVSSDRLLASTVYLRRYAGESAEGIWYVQGIGSADLAVLDVDYDGRRLTGSLVPARDGTLTLSVERLDRSVVATVRDTAQARRLVPLDTAVPGEPGLLVAAVLAGADGSLAVRVFRVGGPDAVPR